MAPRGTWPNTAQRPVACILDTHHSRSGHNGENLRGGQSVRTTYRRIQTSIVAALLARLTVKDPQIAQLKAALRERDRTIAALHGELEKRGGRAEKTVT